MPAIMFFTNTTAPQDRLIRMALTPPPTDGLVEVLQDLDNQLTEWKRAAWVCGARNPDELDALLRRLPKGGNA